MRKVWFVLVGAFVLVGCGQELTVRDVNKSENTTVYRITVDGRTVPCIVFFESEPGDHGSAAISCDWDAAPR